MNRARLLLIEEDYSLRKLIAEHLRRLGTLEVEVADDGAVGVERAHLGRFDVVMASLHLSDMAPARITEALAAVRPAPSVVAIARPERLETLGEDRVRALADVVYLPLTRPSLTDAVVRTLERHHDRACRAIVRADGARPRAGDVLPAQRKAPPNPVRLGHYEIAERIGEGPKGAVYRAVDRRTAEDVAVRALSRSMVERLGTGTRWVERFSREASAAAAVSHRGLAAILDHGFEDDHRCLFLVTELAAGERLSERLARGPLEPGPALRMGLELAAALAAVHAGGFPHRLVRPTNVHLRVAGDATLTDLGVSNLIGWDLMPLRARLAATPYDSPEQIRLGRIDDRSDQFSLGLVLYTALTGAYPFAGESPLARARSIATQAPRLELPAGVAERDLLGEVLRRAMAPRPEERFQSDGELQESLARVAGAQE